MNETTPATVELDSPTLSAIAQSNSTSGTFNQSNPTTISPVQSNQTTADSNKTITHG